MLFVSPAEPIHPRDVVQHEEPAPDDGWAGRAVMLAVLVAAQHGYPQDGLLQRRYALWQAKRGSPSRDKALFRAGSGAADQSQTRRDSHQRQESTASGLSASNVARLKNRPSVVIRLLDLGPIRSRSCASCGTSSSGESAFVAEIHWFMSLGAEIAFETSIQKNRNANLRSGTC
jgi:hypothetical protein